MKQEYKYTVIIEPQSPRGYVVSLPALPGCHTEGKTVEEALKNIKEAIELYLEVLEEQNQDIPTQQGTIISEIALARPTKV